MAVRVDGQPEFGGGPWRHEFARGAAGLDQGQVSGAWMAFGGERRCEPVGGRLRQVECRRERTVVLDQQGQCAGAGLAVAPAEAAPGHAGEQLRHCHGPQIDPIGSGRDGARLARGEREPLAGAGQRRCEGSVVPVRTGDDRLHGGSGRGSGAFVLQAVVQMTAGDPVPMAHATAVRHAARNGAGGQETHEVVVADPGGDGRSRFRGAFERVVVVDPARARRLGRGGQMWILGQVTDPFAKRGRGCAQGRQVTFGLAAQGQCQADLPAGPLQSEAGFGLGDTRELTQTPTVEPGEGRVFGAHAQDQPGVVASQSFQHFGQRLERRLVQHRCGARGVSRRHRIPRRP